MERNKVAVLINIAAGNADAGPQLQEIEKAFAAYGIEPRIWQTRSGTDLNQAAREALKLGFPIIAAAGGDGTVGKVAASLAGTEAALGLLPTGTLNHFAKDLNIPIEIRAAAGTIAEGDRIAVDVGRVNDRIFINNASIGIYPQLLKFRERLQKQGYSKWAAFIPAAFAVLVRSPSLLQVRMNVEEKNIEAATNLIFIGNNWYEITGLQMGIRRRLDENLLSLYLSCRTTRFGLVGLLLRALFGTLRKGNGAPDFKASRAQEMWIHTRRKELEVALDGELLVLKTPLRFTIEPRVLNVIVPK
jgi:YegS/Rv2252/BmrU family lipid kinase